MTPERIAETTILRMAVGSTMLGLNVATSDRDEMGVCIEDIEHLAGFNEFKPYVTEVAKGDAIDSTIYGLRNFLNLCLKGNPNVLSLLFIKPENCMIRTAYGEFVQDLAHHFWSKRAAKAFYNYLRAQRERLNGERGQMGVSRPDLVEKYGFDTKYAMHMIRLGYQGIEFMETKSMTLPLPAIQQGYLLNVRNGLVSLDECNCLCKTLETQLEWQILNSTAPEEGNREAVEKFMVAAYHNVWRGRMNK